MERVRYSYTTIIEPDEDGVYIATVPSIPGVVEQGESPEEAVNNLKEALNFHLSCMAEEGEEIPPSDSPDREVRDIELTV